MTSLNKIKGYRNMLGLTQEQMGKKLGITKQTYHNKEVGKNSFSDKEK
ncbi:transcriptional regulator, putative [Streptococcus infantarius subsp. infantarius CJ18]|nr:transcriptional regulator, putative [Streptococcus infantarius subsp. infantarius CJ18]QBX08451.1 putative transcriptional regulator [Streptococcus satellite phage Javan265]